MLSVGTQKTAHILFFQTYCDLHISWDKQYISSTFGHILKEHLLLQEQTILHMKAPILSFLEPEGQRWSIIDGMPRLLPIKILLSGEK